MSSSFHIASGKFPHLLTALVASALVASCGGASVTQTATYSVGGLASGLVGTGLVLQDNGGDNLPVSGNGPFTFSSALTNGSSYQVTVATQPSNPSQNCIVVNGLGRSPVTRSPACRSNARPRLHGRRFGQRSGGQWPGAAGQCGR